MGLSIHRWGPAAWNTLHVVAHSYPREPTDAQREETRAFLQLFALHLPCPSCRKHFQSLLERRLDDQALSSRARLVAFLNDAHNEVNVRLGKPVWTLEEHYQVYRRGKAPGSPLSAAIFAGLLIVMVLCYTRHRRRRWDT